MKNLAPVSGSFLALPSTVVRRFLAGFFAAVVTALFLVASPPGLVQAAEDGVRVTSDDATILFDPETSGRPGTGLDVYAPEGWTVDLDEERVTGKLWFSSIVTPPSVAYVEQHAEVRADFDSPRPSARLRVDIAALGECVTSEPVLAYQLNEVSPVATYDKLDDELVVWFSEMPSWGEAGSTIVEVEVSCSLDSATSETRTLTWVQERAYEVVTSGSTWFSDAHDIAVVFPGAPSLSEPVVIEDAVADPNAEIAASTTAVPNAPEASKPSLEEVSFKSPEFGSESLYEDERTASERWRITIWFLLALTGLYLVFVIVHRVINERRETSV